jgi:hypothetical protein|tara:strand:- start:18 stop:203 length:186 start_codon:yes stop_codon:yes gene_type:complete
MSNMGNQNDNLFAIQDQLYANARNPILSFQQFEEGKHQHQGAGDEDKDSNIFSKHEQTNQD